jgi:hypothetical protein
MRFRQQRRILRNKLIGMDSYKRYSVIKGTWKRFLGTKRKLQINRKENYYNARSEILLRTIGMTGRSQWPRGLRRGSAAARLLGLWFRIPPGAWMSVSCECCVLSGRGLCDGLITRPDESYRVWCV